MTTSLCRWRYVFWASLNALGCSGGGPSSTAESAPFAQQDARAPQAVGPELGDRYLPPEPLADGGPPTLDGAFPSPVCTEDDDCPETSVCESAVCVPAVPITLEPAADGVLRAGVARFDLSPLTFETWTDHASAECPENRPNAFDGNPYVSSPDDPCLDSFDDADQDGRFDALWLAGAGPDRPAVDIDEAAPPSGRFLALARDLEFVLLFTLDVYAVGPATHQAMTKALSRRLGLSADRILLHATGTRGGPDLVGLWGPTATAASTLEADEVLGAVRETGGLMSRVPTRSGVDPAYVDELVRRMTMAARTACQGLVPVEVRSALGHLPQLDETSHDAPTDVSFSGTAEALGEQLSRPRAWSVDRRFPIRRDDGLRVVGLVRTTGEPLAILVGWGAVPGFAPKAMPRLTADFPGHVRAELEARLPGITALWLTSAGSEEVSAQSTAALPAREGEVEAPLTEVSLATALSTRAVDLYDAALPAPGELTVTQRVVWLPVESPLYVLAAKTGSLPGLAGLLSGARTSRFWASARSTPACGAYGCLRYRLDRLSLGPLALLTTPGALDEAFVHGRPAGELVLTDGPGLNLIDLDLDGHADDERDRANVEAVVQQPLNPQRFEGVTGLGRDDLWLIGRTNGGVGSLLPAGDELPIFEGQLDALAARLLNSPEVRGSAVCASGYVCDDEEFAALTLDELVRDTLAQMPAALKDLPGGHVLRVRGVAVLETTDPLVWWLEAPDRDDEARTAEILAQGDALVLVPGGFAFTLEADFSQQDLPAGTRLRVSGGSLSWVDGFEVVEVVPLDLSRHPNVGARAWALHQGSGDLVYNTACELAFDGLCPHPRPIGGPGDPNEDLPQIPEEARP